MKELRGQFQEGEAIWTFSEGATKFYEVLEQDGSGWTATTRKRYLSSLRQVFRVLDEICEDLGRDIRTIPADEVKVGMVRSS